MSIQTFQFTADTNHLMSLISDTFYSNKEIFLRELISNAADSLEKAKYLLQTCYQMYQPDNPSLQISIIINKAKKTMTIQDNGIGMTKQELIDYLGTIGKSGIFDYSNSYSSNYDTNLIGLFGIGFYSSFIVSDKVQVISQYIGDIKAYIWESANDGTFTVKEYENSDEKSLDRGTKVVLYMKNETSWYLDEGVIGRIVEKYFQLIEFPINICRIEGNDEESKIGNKNIYNVTTYEHSLSNITENILPKNRSSITKSAYINFYKYMTKDPNEHLAEKHFFVEGVLEYKGIIFIPQKSLPNFFIPKHYYETIKVYENNVFILCNCNLLIPDYLSFIKCIINMKDLCSNINKESFFSKKYFFIIKKTVTRMCLSLIFEILEDERLYEKFYKEYAHYIKLGICEDTINRDRLVEFLRFFSSKSGKNMISLDDYISRMQTSQDHIFYITGESCISIENSPFLGPFNEKNLEVLYMVDPIDEYLMTKLKNYENKAFKSCISYQNSHDKGVDGTIFNSKNKKLCDSIKEVLKDNILYSKIGLGIINLPCLIVADDNNWSGNMERVLKAQVLGDYNIKSFMIPKKIIEINPFNDVIIKLREKCWKDEMDKIVKDAIWLLYETSMVVCGFHLENLNGYMNRVYRIVELGLGIL